jgi:hypothetical protein
MVAGRARGAVLAAALLLAAACTGLFVPEYEYEEQVYLDIDGSASVVVDGSLAALVALRGAAIDLSRAADLDRDDIRRAYEAQDCRVETVSRPWTRLNRRYVRVTISVDDIRQLHTCRLLAVSSVQFAPKEESGLLRYHQIVGPPIGPKDAKTLAPWDGSERVAFKLHAPSRVTFHNVKRLEDGENGEVGRGNILTWEQRLSDRLAGVPIEMVVEMESTSILNTTLWVFGGAFGAAVLVLVALIWLAIRRGRKATWTHGPPA